MRASSVPVDGSGVHASTLGLAEGLNLWVQLISTTHVVCTEFPSKNLTPSADQWAGVGMLFTWQSQRHLMASRILGMLIV